MTRQVSSRDAAYFNALYEADPDPWNFTASTYEHQKYDATLAVLGDRHFKTIFEIGCSIGVLTRRLASRCDVLLAADIAPAALTAARTRCGDLPHVSFANLRVPTQWPAAAQKFDLIICSEVLYFLSPADIAEVAARAAGSLTPDGMILLVNYTEQIDEPCNGDEAADLFIAACAETCVASCQQRHSKFRLDLLEPMPAG